MTLCVSMICNAQSNVSLGEAIMMSKFAVSNDNAENIKCFSLQNAYGDTVLYEVVFDDNKAVVISGCKKTKAILAIIDNMPLSVFDEEDVPAGLKYFINRYSSLVNCAIQDTMPAKRPHSEWSLLNGNKNVEDGGNRLFIDRMLTTAWGQDTPNGGSSPTDCAYNYYVEEDHDECSCSEKKCVTGCTSVAMGQIMNYWKYPVYMAKNWQFDWCNMANSLNSSTSNYIAERNAIAWLLWQCGQACNTDYNFLGCNAFALPSNARDGFVDDFGYDSDADHKLRSSHSTSNWKNLIIGNLLNGWPVLYAAVNGSLEGHSFVCDGYNSTTECFHFNFGHNSVGNTAWCTIDSIWEYDDHWNSLERAVFYIHPSSSIDYCNFTLPLWVHYATYYLQNNTPQPYYNVPSTATHLTSVPEQFDASWRTIPSGVTTSYEAHGSVTLVPGFHAARGSNFSVRVDPCPACEDAQRNKSTQSTIGDWAETETASTGYKPTSLEKEVLLKVYPNPTDGLVTVQFYLLEDSYVETSIYDMTGAVKQVLSKGERLKGFNTEKHDVSRLPNGMYVVKVTIDGVSYTNKMIKQ